MIQGGVVFLTETDTCAVKDAFKNNPGHADFMRKFFPEVVYDELIKKLRQPVLLTIPNNPSSAFFFGSLATVELKRLMDDPAVRCRHTAQDHIHSLLFIIDSLDCAQS
jgi:hypothetical protein